MIQKRMQRKAEEQKNTVFLYNGWEWPTEKIDRYRERHHIEDSALPSCPLGKLVSDGYLLRVCAN